MQRALSAIKPSGELTLGNLIGGIMPLVAMQSEYSLAVFIADLHALTKPIKPEELKLNTENLITTYLACGLDPANSLIFKQSDVPAHSQLEWILTCNTNLSELTKMPQYKMYCEQHSGKHDGIGTGMLLYPSLMSADILLYSPDAVPVGEDQMTHVYLCRDIAEKFNKTYSTNILKPVKAVQPKVGAKIMSLSDPTKKMSKSESDKGTIYLLEDLESVRSKIMKAKTDSENKIYYDKENKPGISNLISILAALTYTDIDTVVEANKDKSYGDFKKEVADVVCLKLADIQNKVKNLKNCQESVSEILAVGAKRANEIANKKLNEVYKVVGLR